MPIPNTGNGANQSVYGSPSFAELLRRAVQEWAPQQANSKADGPSAPFDPNFRQLTRVSPVQAKDPDSQYGSNSAVEADPPFSRTSDLVAESAGAVADRPAPTLAGLGGSCPAPARAPTTVPEIPLPMFWRYSGMILRVVPRGIPLGPDDLNRCPEPLVVAPRTGKISAKAFRQDKTTIQLEAGKLRGLAGRKRTNRDKIKRTGAKISLVNTNGSSQSATNQKRFVCGEKNRPCVQNGGLREFLFCSISFDAVERQRPTFLHKRRRSYDSCATLVQLPGESRGHYSCLGDTRCHGTSHVWCSTNFVMG